MRNRSVKKYLLDFKDYMEINNYSSHNIANTLTMIRTFYTEYDIMLPKMHLSGNIMLKVVKIFHQKMISN